MSGVADKAAIGSTSSSLIHTYDLYGGAVAARLLTAASRVSVAYLQRSSLTIGIEDFVTRKKFAQTRRKSLK